MKDETMKSEAIIERAVFFFEQLVIWLGHPSTYYQALLVLAVVLLVFCLGRFIRYKIKFLEESAAGVKEYSRLWFLQRSGRLLYPFMAILLLIGAEAISADFLQDASLVQAVQRVVAVWALWVALRAFVTNTMVRTVGLWVLVPSAMLQLFGWFDTVALRLDSYGFSLGEVNITAYTLVKAVFYVSILVWIGRLSSQAGERYIRQHKSLSRSTKELLVKLFDITLYAVLFLVTLNLLGIDLTALAVFGGALGVGLGFGLQKIASNFISGLILLTEKSINIGNLIEMNDGIFGYVRKLGARASIVETFDGKEVMVPNEDFITSRVSNLTYSNTRGRVEVHIGVAYEADLKLVHDLILASATEYRAASKEKDFLPECYLREFGDSSVNFLLIFWLDDVTQGRWRAQSDVMFSAWEKLKAHNINIPYPQRDLHIRSGLDGVIKNTPNVSKKPE